MNNPQKVEIEVTKFQTLLEDVMKRLGEEDPSELDAYRKLFRKTVPFFLRSYVATFLLRQTLPKSGLRKRPDQVTTLFVSIGKNRKIFPRDLVTFFVSGAELKKSDIGDIKIMENYSFIEVTESLAAKTIEQLDGTSYRGRRVTVNFAKKRAPGDSNTESPEMNDENQLATVED